jgi:tetratricopeptide (TPR) repeat protein
VKGLQVGDTLEYESHTEIISPLIPGQFWFNYSFFRGPVALQEELQISVPRGRYVQVKNRDVQPTSSDQGDVRIYDWKTANLKPTSSQDKKDTDSADSADADDEIPSVQLTSFHSWDEVGQWFKSLVDTQAAVTPAIQAKADAVTMSAASYSDKVHALYDFVSTKVRYVGISLGIGRYQPHAAADVLSSDFGDCKDKHTLFSSLLAAKNIKAVPALINSGAKIDPDVPSPGQFDHVITALPQDKGYLFLDTTPEVAPYGLLMSSLRDKQALVIPAEGPATLMETPKDPPFRPYDHFSADATLDEAGTLASKNQMTFRGDTEVVFRAILRQAGPAKWNDVMQSVMSNLGFAGTVSEVSAGSPDATDTPFQITYNYNRKEYSDWANRQITPPMPPFIIPNVSDDKKTTKPLKIGSPEEMLYQATLKLPAGSAPALPVAVNLHESFADYRAAYSFADGTIHAERRLTTKVSEIPVAQIEAYRAFVKAIVDDEDTYIPLRGGSSVSSTSIAAPRDSQGTPEALAFLRETQRAAQGGDVPAALDAAQQAVDADPQFSIGWLVLGSLQVSMHKEDQGVVSLKKAIALNASDPSRYEPIAAELVKTHQEQGALDIWRALETARPDDTNPPVQIAGILMGRKQYSDAVKELEPVAQKNPNDVAVLMQLGQAYFHLPNKEKGSEFIVRAANMTHDAKSLNNAAYLLADNGVHLDEALRYAQDAARQAESATANISLSDLTLADVRSMPAMAADWDTMGWVQYQLGHLDAAEKYLNSAWRLTQSPLMADHLGQVYEKEGKKHDAALAYSHALASGENAPEGTDKRLDAVQKGVRFQDQEHPDAIALQDARTTKIPWKFTQYESAEFFVLFGPGSKVVDAKYVSGSQALQNATKVIAATHFDEPIPDDSSAQILRRGLLSCGNSPAAGAGQCLFVLYPAAQVNSVK